MTDEHKRLDIAGVIVPTAGGHIHPDLAVKFVKDLMALAAIHGVEFIGMVTGRLDGGRSLLLHRTHAALDNEAAVVKDEATAAGEESAQLPPAPVDTHIAVLRGDTWYDQHGNKRWMRGFCGACGWPPHVGDCLPTTDIEYATLGIDAHAALDNIVKHDESTCLRHDERGCAHRGGVTGAYDGTLALVKTDGHISSQHGDYLAVDSVPDGRGVYRTADPARIPLHKHHHDHNDDLPPGVVKVEHEHWHAHALDNDYELSTRQPIHSGRHVNFGAGDTPGHGSMQHYADTVDSIPPELLGKDAPCPRDGEIGIHAHFEKDGHYASSGVWPLDDEGKESLDPKADSPDDERLLTEHAKVCPACRDCAACREVVPHSHLDVSLNIGAHMNTKGSCQPC